MRRILAPEGLPDEFGEDVVGVDTRVDLLGVIESR
jgi:hypothetical protein